MGCFVRQSGEIWSAGKAQCSEAGRKNAAASSFSQQAYRETMKSGQAFSYKVVKYPTKMAKTA
jgi:hypothetical protein